MTFQRGAVGIQLFWLVLTVPLAAGVLYVIARGIAIPEERPEGSGTLLVVAILAALLVGLSLSIRDSVRPLVRRPTLAVHEGGVVHAEGARAEVIAWADVAVAQPTGVRRGALALSPCFLLRRTDGYEVLLTSDPRDHGEIGGARAAVLPDVAAIGATILQCLAVHRAQAAEPPGVSPDRRGS